MGDHTEQPAEQPPTLADVWKANPGWDFFEGVGGLVYCRKLLSSPPVVFRDTSPLGLAEQIADYKRNGPHWRRPSGLPQRP